MHPRAHQARRGVPTAIGDEDDELELLARLWMETPRRDFRSGSLVRRRENWLGRVMTV